jgi:hypothetical protein
MASHYSIAVFSVIKTVLISGSWRASEVARLSTQLYKIICKSETQSLYKLSSQQVGTFSYTSTKILVAQLSFYL